MFDIKSFIKQSSIYTISTFLSRSISFLLLPFYSRVLSPADFGAVDILTVTCSLVNMTIALEIHQAIARFYNEWKADSRKEYISTAFIFTVLIYSVFSFLLVPFKEELAAFFLDDAEKTNVISAAIILSWSTGLYYFTQSQLRWQLLSSKHAITSIVFTMSTTLVTILLVVTFRLGVLGVIYGLVSGNLIGILLAIYFSKQSYGFLFCRGKLSKMLTYSTPLVLSSVSVFLSMYIDRIMIKNMLSLTDLGLFSIGYRFASIVGLLLVGLNSAITPLIYSHYKDPSTPIRLEQIFRLFGIGALILFVSITILSKELLATFTTSAYKDAADIIPFLVLTSLVASMNNFTPGLFIGNRTKIIAGINVLVGVINFSMNLLLIPVWGILGAGIATLLGYCISFLIYYYYNQRYYPIKFYWWTYFHAFVWSLITIYMVSLLPDLGLWTALLIKIPVLLLFSMLSFSILADVELKKKVLTFAFRR